MSEIFNTDRILQFWDRVHATDPLLPNTPELWDDELVLTQEQVEAALAQTLGPLWTPELKSLLIGRMGDKQPPDREGSGKNNTPEVSLQKAAIAEAIVLAIPWLEDPSQRKISGALLRVFRKPDPQKGGRAAALKRWEKLQAEGVDFKEYMAKVRAAKRPIEERQKDGSIYEHMAKARAARRPIEERRKDGSLAAHIVKMLAAQRPLEERRKDGSLAAHMAKMRTARKAKAERRKEEQRNAAINGTPHIQPAEPIKKESEISPLVAYDTPLDEKKTEE